jgi:hypothetical protein
LIRPSKPAGKTSPGSGDLQDFFIFRSKTIPGLIKRVVGCSHRPEALARGAVSKIAVYRISSSY